MDREDALENTHRFLAMLKEPRFTNDDWANELDALFLQSGFSIDLKNQLVIKNGWAYFVFRVPTDGEARLFAPSEPLDYMANSILGAVVLDENENVLFAYSVGDVLSLRLYGKSRVIWGGGWGKEPDIEGYRKGGMCWAGKPNAEMLPPLVARAVEFGLRRVFKTTESLKESEPGVCVVRLGSHDKPEDSSDIQFNVFSEDFGSDKATIDHFIDLVNFLLPFHLRKRFYVTSSMARQPKDFQSLVEYIKMAGLEPAVDGA